MSHSANMNYLSYNLPTSNKNHQANNHQANNYPVNINDHAYNSCSNDEYDALESNVPYISKNRPYSPKSKLYYAENYWDILAFIVVTTLLVLLLFTTTQIKNQQNTIQDNHDNNPENSPASIYENYNHIGNEDVDPEYYKINTRSLHQHHSADLNYLHHFDDLNDGSNYYFEYYKTQLQELCDLSLKKANKSSNKENKKIN
jgi:hypothetical protein